MIKYIKSLFARQSFNEFVKELLDETEIEEAMYHEIVKLRAEVTRLQKLRADELAILNRATDLIASWSDERDASSQTSMSYKELYDKVIELEKEVHAAKILADAANADADRISLHATELRRQRDYFVEKCLVTQDRVTELEKDIEALIESRTSIIRTNAMLTEEIRRAAISDTCKENASTLDWPPLSELRKGWDHTPIANAMLQHRNRIDGVTYAIFVMDADFVHAVKPDDRFCIVRCEP